MFSLYNVLAGLYRYVYYRYMTCCYVKRQNLEDIPISRSINIPYIMKKEFTIPPRKRIKPLRERGLIPLFLEFDSSAENSAVLPTQQNSAEHPDNAAQISDEPPNNLDSIPDAGQGPRWQDFVASSEASAEQPLNLGLISDGPLLDPDDVQIAYDGSSDGYSSDYFRSDVSSIDASAVLVNQCRYQPCSGKLGDFKTQAQLS